MSAVAHRIGNLWVEDSGGELPPLLLSHGLMWNTRMFDAQVAALRDRYRCVAWDHPGQGQSATPRTRSITIEHCYDEAVTLIEQLALGPVHLAGLSMGGFVAMRIAARRPDLLRSCILMETSADAEPAENLPRYRRLRDVARWLSPRAVAAPVMQVMFGRSVLTDPARAEERAVWQERLAANKRSVYRAVNGVLERKSVFHELARIRVPTLIIVGEEDVATVPAKAERLHGAIPGSQLVHIPAAGHSSAMEQPEAVTAAMSEFLKVVDRV